MTIIQKNLVCHPDSRWSPQHSSVSCMVIMQKAWLCHLDNTSLGIDPGWIAVSSAWLGTSPVYIYEPAHEKRGVTSFFKFYFFQFSYSITLPEPSKTNRIKNSISSQSNGCSKRPCLPVNMHRQTNWTFNHHHFVKFCPILFNWKLKQSLWVWLSSDVQGDCVATVEGVENYG